MKKVKKLIQYGGLIIKLYDLKFHPNENASNIEAFDLDGNLVWTVDPCPHGRYWEMELDEANDQIEANEGSAMFYKINISTGSIIQQGMRK